LIDVAGERVPRALGGISLKERGLLVLDLVTDDADPERRGLAGVELGEVERLALFPPGVIER
jgi:hypothetical protein